MKLNALKTWLAKKSTEIQRDVIGLTGLGLVTYGVFLIYAPAGFIVAGGLLIALATGISSKVNKQ
jgi:hypothetical protein